MLFEEFSPLLAKALEFGVSRHRHRTFVVEKGLVVRERGHFITNVLQMEPLRLRKCRFRLGNIFDLLKIFVDRNPRLDYSRNVSGKRPQLTQKENMTMNTTEQRRAKKGGEMGINGLPYAGGTFLPNTQLGKMTKARKGGSGKVEVAPYVWEVAPEGKLPIFSRIRAFAKMIGGKMEIYVSNESLAFYGWTREEMQEQVDRFNAGERWR